MHMLTFQYLAHIGRLDFSEKKPGSYEGSGVSVSVHPAAWGRIARIGSEGFILNKASGSEIELVDALRLSNQQKADVIAWAKGMGLIEDREVWIASYFDVEMEQRCSFECPTRENARLELEDLPRKRIAGPKTVISATAKLLSAESHAPDDIASSSLTFDLALIRFVQSNLAADGIWWDERLDVAAYSAPRGVVFTSKLGSLDRFAMNFADMGEDECILDDTFAIEDRIAAQTLSAPH